MRIARIFATGFRGMTFNYALESIAAITGPNRLGKTTILRAAILALTGSDGYVKANLDLVRKYSLDGGSFSVGVQMDDGTMIERRFTPGKDVEISLMPNGRNGGKKEMEKAILERLGNLPMFQAALSEDLREAKDRAAFLASLCPMTVSEVDVRKELKDVAIPVGQKLASIDDLTAFQTACDDLVKKLDTEFDQAAKAARENSATSVSVTCPYSQTDQDRTEGEIAESNTAVTLAEEAAKAAVTDSERILELDKDIAGIELKPVDFEAAETNYKAVLEGASAVVHNSAYARALLAQALEALK